MLENESCMSTKLNNWADLKKKKKILGSKIHIVIKEVF